MESIPDNSLPDQAPGVDYRHALKAISQGPLLGARIFLASNRGPVELQANRGAVYVRRGMGGLVTAISSALQFVDATWLAAALSEADAAAAHLTGGEAEIPLGTHSLKIALLAPNREEFHRYYDDIANRLLWFLLHGIAHAPTEPDFDLELWSSWTAYRKINSAFASKLAALAAIDGKIPLVLVQDFHLFLVPGMLRKRRPHAKIAHFSHISWPGPDAWRVLPKSVREEILWSLLACDIVGFHTWRYATNFCLTCREFLKVDVDLEMGKVRHQGRDVQVRAYPISIDPESLASYAMGAAVRCQERQLSRFAMPGVQVILQVARSDPSKNVLRSFKAFELFLQRNPAARGRTCFWAILPASRQGAEPYRQYLEQIKAQAAHLEARWGTESWRPVLMFTDDNYARGIAAMTRYDVLLVNSLADGMNLVAKEGPIVNQRNGVLLLSENTGAAEELANGSLLIHPHDIVGMATAIEQAIFMPAEKRKEMIETLRSRIRLNPVFRWLYEQLCDLMAHDSEARFIVSPFWRTP
ncbi:MAG: trehalose-6-phosphate synthase [Cyanobacteria bacterium NC_groundwater_1444_Ag_S-0.65um_54_12]|nr:trehalose-6-phosphate synthase [Cyanobacteria bacterium NC_groundwater_1444_Ag_S-0.65um_54_12]